MGKTFTEELAKIIQQKRTDKRLTQEEVAKLMGTTRSTYANWEQGIRRFDYETIVQLCTILDIDIVKLSEEMKKYL